MILPGSSMNRWLEVGLVGAVCVAVLGFGGTVPWIFAVGAAVALSQPGTNSERNGGGAVGGTQTMSVNQ